ncbi:TonB-dependent receptor [Flavobacterium dankookense]|uniref:TonB-dependent receptor-like protein n=1 Tax=Flavobacterium dankookense TaxID=706186 RepID=A0A4V3CS13_9FLAO|nr:TonB-dependent receptor [Flavobacterium dankookense]TDP58842.1 TonB-dependent receptor-like protein [Flavobacterium dankookense]
MKIYLFIVSLFFCSISFAQTTVSGSVKDSKNEPVPGANVKVQGESTGTITDLDGNFTLSTSKKPPFEIEISTVGYGSKTVSITSNNQKITAVMSEQETQLDEIVVSASRAPEKIRESPVTIERMTIKDIKKSASPTFYDGLENLKEVQMNTSSMSFKSINTRGFATVANTRFLQLVDGMDNSSPLLNFVLGNLIGISEIDVQSVELLPGASSALYGANAFNGILFMNSQSPFTSQGITAYAKYGMTSQNAAGNNLYYDYGVRVAHAFSKHFAAKANFTFMNGTDWFATNYDDISVEGRDRSHHSYNGINVYGDEAKLNLKNRNPFGSTAYNLLPNEDITRTGYNETDLTESKVQNSKIDFSLHFKPWDNDIEIIWQSKFGFGNSIYQGASRYNLNGFFMQQHKLELKGKNFFLRGYTTTEDGGKSYDMTFTALNINRKWKSDQQWFSEYGGAFGAATLGLVPNVGTTPAEAHAYARSVADTGRLIPGTPAFKQAFNEVIANPDVLQGSKLVDNSTIYHSDANYNFRDLFKPAEIQVGGSYRAYRLDSGGRIYTDASGPINYDEYGVYTQVQKKLLNDKLKLTGSVRYDKAQNFDGNFSPRVSFVYSADEQKNHNFRGSFQTGFRNPVTQDQYIGFNIGNRVLIGSAPDNLTRFTETLPISPQSGGGFATLTGEAAYLNSFTIESFNAFDNTYRSGPPSGLANAATLLVKATPNLVKPETVKAFDLGYRGNVKGFSIDVNGYYNIYNDFIGNNLVIAPYFGTAETSPTNVAPGSAAQALSNRDFREYQVYTNTKSEITSVGFGLGVSKKVYKDFELSANYNFADFDFDQASDPGFEASFNTPKHRVKGTISNDKLIGNLGLSLSARWNTEYEWESSFADGIIEEATVIDVQANYSLKSLKSIIKVGATNIGGREYGQVLGAGLIGQQYFVSWTVTP